MSGGRRGRGRSGRNQPRYPRTARLNELLREIVAEELERVDDDRLAMVTVTGVDCETDVARAVVFFDSLDGPEGDEEILEALGEHRQRLQSSVNRQTHLKRTPLLEFRPDEVLRRADHMEGTLRTLRPSEQPEVLVPDEIARAEEAATRAAALAAEGGDLDEADDGDDEPDEGGGAPGGPAR